MFVFFKVSPLSSKNGAPVKAKAASNTPPTIPSKFVLETISEAFLGLPMYWAPILEVNFLAELSASAITVFSILALISAAVLWESKTPAVISNGNLYWFLP